MRNIYALSLLLFVICSMANLSVCQAEEPYASLSERLSVQWEKGDGPAAQATVKRMLGQGFKSIVDTDLATIRAAQDEENFGFYVGSYAIREELNTMIGVLATAPSADYDLATAILFHKDLSGELRRGIYAQLYSPVISPAGRQPDPGLDNMRVTKQALISIATGISAEAYGSKNIAVDEIAPPFTLERRFLGVERRLTADASSGIADEEISIASLSEAIPDTTIVIEYIKYDPQPPLRISVNKPHYIAMAIDHHGLFAVKDLGLAVEIDTMVYDFCRKIVASNNPGAACPDPGYELCKGIVSRFNNGKCPTNRYPQMKDHWSRKSISEISKTLYDLLLKPFETFVAPNADVVISPDYTLFLLPFEALTDGGGEPFIQQHVVSYVNSVREISRWKHSRHRESSPPVIIGNPDYGKAASSTCNEQDGRPATNKRSGTDFLFFSQLCGAAAEMASVKSAFPKAAIYSGRRATEERVKTLHGPEILHLATHGFALSAPAWEAAWRAPVPNWTERDSAVFAIDHSWRQGVALAGAMARKSPDGSDDGILSAVEARLLDLHGTSLVVLSACETQRGNVSEDGIAGLSSAFADAGARARTLALWDTDDSLSGDFMGKYYSELAAGRGNAAALASAKRLFLRQGGNKAQPSTWAVFVTYGYPGPLGD